MEKRYDVSILVSNGKGCAYTESKTFIDKDFSEVMNYIDAFCEANKDLHLSINVFEGWGLNQKQIRKMVSYPF